MTTDDELALPCAESARAYIAAPSSAMSRAFTAEMCRFMLSEDFGWIEGMAKIVVAYADRLDAVEAQRREAVELLREIKAKRLGTYDAPVGPGRLTIVRAEPLEDAGAFLARVEEES